MRSRLPIVLSVVIVFSLTVAATQRTSGAQAQRSVSGAAGCSKAAAVKAMTRYRIGVVEPFQPRTPVNQVQCGPLFGRGSRGMVASVAIPGCGISAGWAVFRHSGGTWKLAKKVDHGAFLDVVGGDIRETIGVLARGDAHCFPSSVKYHFWRWNGKRFVVGPWQRAWSYDSILSQDGQVWCRFVFDPAAQVFCGTRNRQLATLRLNGSFTACNDCLQNWDERARVIANGQANEWNKFHCLVEESGVTCTVIGGAATGRGFLINASGVTEVRP